MEPTTIRFGPFELDTRAAELRKKGIRLGLQDQPYQILRMLLDRPGDVVLRDEIRAKLWPDGTIVEFDHSINAAVKRLRDALNDSADKPRYIETLPKRGYRFIGEVEVPPPVESLPEPPAKVVAVPVEIASPPSFRRAALALAGILILTIGGYYATRISGQDWAAKSSGVERLTAAGRYEEAYTLATEVLQHAPEPRVSRLMSELTDELSVVSTPPGAEVYLRRLGSTKPGSITMEKIGVTPLQHFTVARGEFILSIRKSGYENFERTISSAVHRDKPFTKSPWEIHVDQSLHPTGSVPTGMVAVQGGGYSLRVNSRLTDETVPLADYFIDKFEISNQAYKAFLDTGGYARPELLKQTTLKDKTGLPGPRGWVGGTFPQGKEKHPVTGITWMEASSFCQAAGKQLPTAFQWEKAAREPDRGPFGIVVPWGLLKSSDVPLRANFDSAGTAAVDGYEFGMSPVGAYNMAGNVEEWLRNPYDDGFAAGGGAWSDPAYRFGTLGPRPAQHSSETLGFRCALTASNATGNQGGMAFTSNRKIPSYPASTSAEFRTLQAHYSYAKTPLNAKVVGVQEADQWRREEVTFIGYGGDTVTAYLYLPKTPTHPYQVIHYLSGTGWLHGLPLTDSVERSPRLAPYLRSGRAIFMVALKGFFGREPGLYADLADGSPQHLEAMSSWTMDMQRGVDYLLTRPDVDSHKIALWNDSTTNYATVFAAIEKRYAAVILVGASLYFDTFGRLPPTVNPLRFAPHISPPKLVLNGLYDDLNPQKTAVEPFFQLLSNPKKLVNFEGGHIPPPEIAVPIVKPWLDETMGPVSRK